MKNLLTKRFVIILAASLTFLILTDQIQAKDLGEEEPTESIGPEAPLTQVIAKPTTNLVLGETYYTVLFSTATTGAVKTIEMAFSPGFDVLNARLIEVSGIKAGQVSVSGQTVFYTVNATPPPLIKAGKTIKVMVAGIINNFSTTPQVIPVTTKDEFGTIIDGPSSSADILLTQIQTPMIEDSAITSDKIAPGAIGSIQINNAQVQTRVAGSCAPGSSIRTVNPDGTVSCEPDDTGGQANDLVCTGCVGSTDIGDGSVGGIDIGAGAVGTSNIAVGAVTSTQIADKTITAANIAPVAVTGEKIADGAVGSVKIADGSIIGNDISSSTVLNVAGLHSSIGSNFQATNPCANNFFTRVGLWCLETNGSLGVLRVASTDEPAYVLSTVDPSAKMAIIKVVATILQDGTVETSSAVACLLPGDSPVISCDTNADHLNVIATARLANEASRNTTVYFVRTDALGQVKTRCVLASVGVVNNFSCDWRVIGYMD